MSSLIWNEDKIGKYDSVATKKGGVLVDTENSPARVRRNFFKTKTGIPVFTEYQSFECDVKVDALMWIIIILLASQSG